MARFVIKVSSLIICKTNLYLVNTIDPIALSALSTITKNRFCHTPRDSDKLQGFVWETYVSDMKIVHKIRSERF